MYRSGMALVVTMIMMSDYGIELTRFVFFFFFFFLMIRRPPRSTQGVSSAASDVYKRQAVMPAPLSVERDLT
ncbi:hypothetical protein AMBR_DPAELIID_02781 [Lacticaseibacillus rhamnosus]|nr:hypothetical protein AMBR_DPAELIID_02781 [Lacticaseibacillus rhamnosus]